MTNKKKKQTKEKIKTLARVGAGAGVLYLLWEKVIAPKVIGGM